VPGLVCPWLVYDHGSKKSSWFARIHHRDGISSGHILVVPKWDMSPKGVLKYRSSVLSLPLEVRVSQAEADGTDKLEYTNMFVTSHALKETKKPLPANVSCVLVMRGEKGRMSMGINRVNMLRHSMNLLILLLIWISPILEPWTGLWFGWNPPRVSIEFLLGRKNVCLVRERGWNNWPLHFGLTNWVDNFEGVRFLVHGLVAGVAIGVIGSCRTGTD